MLIYDSSHSDLKHDTHCMFEFFFGVFLHIPIFHFQINLICGLVNMVDGQDINPIFTPYVT